VLKVTILDSGGCTRQTQYGGGGGGGGVQFVNTMPSPVPVGCGSDTLELVRIGRVKCE